MKPSKHRSRGFTLIELTVVMAVATVITVLGARAIVDEARRVTGDATAVYLNVLRGGVVNYIATNYNALGGAIPVVPGFADPLQPTLAELRTAGMLPTGFANFAPVNIPPAVRVDRVNCPGLNCRLDALIWLTQPIREASGDPILWLASEIRGATEGGVASGFQNSGTLVGPSGTAVNPLGAVPGTVGVTTSVDTVVYNQFVRRNDTRLTELNEALTVNAGPLATGGNALQVNGNQSTTGSATVGGQLTVAGSTSLNGEVRIEDSLLRVRNASGNNCFEATPAGIVTVRCGGSVTTPSASVTGAINVGGNAVVGGGLNVAGTASANALAVTNNASVGGDVSATGDVAAGGDLSAAGVVQANRARLNTVTLGATCTVTGSEFAATSTNGLAVCRSGKWVALAQIGTQGSLCTGVAIGAFAVDQATGVALVCRNFPSAGNQRWVSATSLMSQFVPMTTSRVKHGDMVAKPNCGTNGGAYAPAALPVLIPAMEGSADGTFVRTINDLGTSWQVRITNALEEPLPASQAILIAFCHFPT